MHCGTGVDDSVNCLAFADDIILFTNGSKNCLKKIMDFLKLYEDISGQMVNIDKSSFTIASRLPPGRLRIVANTTGFRQEALPITYLGIQLYKGHGRNFLFEPLSPKFGRGWPLDKGSFFLLEGELRSSKVLLIGDPGIELLRIKFATLTVRKDLIPVDFVTLKMLSLGNYGGVSNLLILYGVILCIPNMWVTGISISSSPGRMILFNGNDYSMGSFWLRSL